MTVKLRDGILIDCSDTENGGSVRFKQDSFEKYDGDAWQDVNFYWDNEYNYSIANIMGGNSQNDHYQLFENSWVSRTAWVLSSIYNKASSLEGGIQGTGGRVGSTDHKTNSRFDINANSWSSKTDMSIKRILHGQNTLNDKMYVTCGYTGVNTSTHYQYDLTGNSWANKTSAPTAGYIYNFNTATHENIYILCVYTGSISQTLKKYDDSGNSWSSSTNYPNDTKSGCACSDGIDFWGLLGVDNSSSVFLKNVYKYSVAGVYYTAKTDASLALSSSFACYIKHKIKAIAGYNGSQQNDHQEYDPLSNSWALKTDVPYSTSSFGGSSM